MFDDVGVRVAALDPYGGWRGGAARAYGSCARVQCRQVMVMADLDRLSAQLVSGQAHAVKTTYDVLSGLIYGVSGLVGVCGVLELRGDLLVSFRIAIVFCGAALAIAAGFLIDLADVTARHGDAVRAAAQRVSTLVAALPTGSGAALGRPMPASPGAGPAPADQVSPFALADHTAPSPLTADLGSALAGLPGAPQFHLATGARAGLPDFGAPGLPVPPLTGMPTPPDVSGVLAGLPTIAPLSTTLGRLGGLAGPTNAVSPTATTATRAGHHIPDHGSASPESAGAAATTTTQRAPIDAQTRPTHQQRQRVV
ncbi:hypothetical protein NJB1604_24800 [Mycobacterium marinum]|nr:hypothetical protein NJB1604_24800 [Mycobacterium marinum]